MNAEPGEARGRVAEVIGDGGARPAFSRAAGLGRVNPTWLIVGGGAVGIAA